MQRRMSFLLFLFFPFLSFFTSSNASALPNLVLGFSPQELRAVDNQDTLAKLDSTVLAELLDSGVLVEKMGERQKGSVPSLYVGRLGIYEFKRAWNYWVVKGHFPHELAMMIHDDPICRDAARVNGYMGEASPRMFGSVSSFEVDNLDALKRFVEIVKGFGCSRIL